MKPLEYSDDCSGPLYVLYFESDPTKPPLRGCMRRKPVFPDLEIQAGLSRAFVRAHIASGREVQIVNRAGGCVFHSKEKKLIYPEGDGLTQERFERFWKSLP